MLVFHRLATSTGLLPALRALESYRRARRAEPEARAMLEQILPAIAPPEGAAGPWRVQRLAPTLGEITVIMLGPQGQGPSAVVKVARSDAAARSLRRYRRALRSLSGDGRLGEPLRRLLPRLLGAGEVAGRAFLVETLLPGSPLLGAAGQGGLLRAQAAAAATIGELHRATARAVPFDGRLRARLIDGRLAVLRRALASHPQAGRLEAALDRLGGELRGALEGRRLALSWVHGDFAPDNILAGPGGAAITGLVDWELADPADLPALDVAQLLLASRLKLGQAELGPVVEDVLHGAGWAGHEAALLEAAAAGLPGAPIGLRHLALLCWLRHVSDTLGKATRYARNRFWLAANVEHVLARL